MSIACISLCLWMIISSTVTYGMVSTNMYYYTKVMSQLFLDTPLSTGNHATFRSLSTMEDFWKVDLSHPTPSTFALGVKHSNHYTVLPSLKMNLNTISVYSNKMLPTFLPTVHRGAFPEWHVLGGVVQQQESPRQPESHLL